MPHPMALRKPPIQCAFRWRSYTTTTTTTTATQNQGSRTPRRLTAQQQGQQQQPSRPASRSNPVALDRPPGPSAAKIARYRKLPLLLAGGTAFLLSFYLASLYKNLTSLPRHDHDPDGGGSQPQRCQGVPLDVTDRFSKTAATYDRSVGGVELWTGTTLLRRRLVARARGNVLEAAAGTGRNGAYYDLRRCDSVTMVDLSAEMLEVARRKWEELHKGDREGWAKGRFLQGTVLEGRLGRLVPAGKEGKMEVGGKEGEERRFDTVVQTMGLCSTPEPVRELRALGEAVKEDGRVLLLEHGRSYYAWLNDILDRTAPAHADRHGCWWNKDIGRIVEESGLEVVEMKRYHFGTTWWVELKPGKRRREEALEKPAQLPPAAEAPAQARRWWAFWR